MSSGGSSPAQGPYQERLINFCRAQGTRPPVFQIMSDRRGGRTAWSCTAVITGLPVLFEAPARFWYDGQYVNNAREDAAQVALQKLGVLPAPPVVHAQARQQPSPHQQQGQHFFGAING